MLSQRAARRLDHASFPPPRRRPHRHAAPPQGGGSSPASAIATANPATSRTSSALSAMCRWIARRAMARSCSSRWPKPSVAGAGGIARSRPAPELRHKISRCRRFCRSDALASLMSSLQRLLVGVCSSVHYILRSQEAKGVCHQPRPVRPMAGGSPMMAASMRGHPQWQRAARGPQGGESGAAASSGSDPLR